MKNLIFILLLLGSITAYSQDETPKDSFPPLKKGSLKMGERPENYLNPDISGNKPAMTRYDLYQPLQKEDVKEINLNLPPLDIYQGPPVEGNNFTRYPFANDYSYYSGMYVSDGAWLSSSSIQNAYPTIGAVRTVNMRFNYQPADWLVISGGPYGSKYALYGANYNDAGVGGSMKFILHDRVRINGYGQYSVRGKHNGVAGPMMGMYPQTYYGGTIELKISEKFGIEGGIIRELNPFNGKWVNRPYIAPVFYSK
jgi:hypothetical protein